MKNVFRIQKELHVPVSIDQTWQAIATKQGQVGWSPDPYSAPTWKIIKEEQPVAFIVRTPTEPNGAFHAFAYHLSPLDEGTALNFVHSGYLGDDWAADFDYAEITGYGWNLYMHTLKQYLTHFTGRPAMYIAAHAPDHANTHQAWQTLERALGLPDDGQLLTVGDEVQLAPDGLPTIEGVVDYVEPGEDFLAVRSVDGLYRFHSLERIGLPIAIGHYIYNTSGQPESQENKNTLEKAWQAWLDRIF